MKHGTQGRDEKATPQRRIWTVVAGGLRVTGLAAPTNRVDNPDQWGWGLSLSLSLSLPHFSPLSSPVKEASLGL
jgi:hypothetical protein